MRKLLLLIEICLLAWLLTGSVRYEAKKEIPVNTPEFDWENYNIITHALGGIDGLTYLNSRESFINYYDKGCRLFEVETVSALRKWKNIDVYTLLRRR